ncbi:MAG TPA: bifunctional 23S rRNA (guanine(2069)-N(7))-methyltransferase RlmK/23S rRNA (guanine(2445)-N(2))-methyltransferase RlmL, partial [Gammaproteobacteria bacterium]|nr:bifunctional 23S rRNA (guanine(2069)-N(7))-methyltransferase RlmK/23S rRNA (guanine(2445)-N(2))-methyltransferase RlmL [Gammaproteobacteria bacterium]
RSEGAGRPSVMLNDPDIRIHAHLYGDKLNLSLDLAGESLHKRGYRLDSTSDAPMKENLAAALLIRAKWASESQNYKYFIDPMCGSGTLLIEAALMASDTAPGLLRKKFGFSHWQYHDVDIWQALVIEAQVRSQAGRSQPLPDIRGFDASPRAVSTARENIEHAGLDKWIDVSVRELSHLSAPTHLGKGKGLLMSNPPYGERLGDEASLKPLYQHFGARLREGFEGWDVALFLGNFELGKAMRIRPYKSYAFFNGTIPCKLLLMHITPEWYMREQETKPDVTPTPAPAVELSIDAQMFANRLRKNLKALTPWVKKNNIHAYRLYDADMPEYAVAIDCYNDWAHVQEYAAPKTVDPLKARARLEQICLAIPNVLDISPQHIVLKERRQQKDFSQYEKISTRGEYLTIEEGACKLLVNLHDYLDTGLFLDHRPMRLFLASIAKGKRILNLFCYTGSVTVHAAMGGARASVSVDMSATYTAWAR